MRPWWSKSSLSGSWAGAWCAQPGRTSALEQALPERRPFAGRGLVCHSDRGSQYVGIRYTEPVAEADIEPSVSSVGDSYDYALAETIIGLFKTEVIHRRDRWRSFEAVEFAALEWADWFNQRRLLEPTGNTHADEPHRSGRRERGHPVDRGPDTNLNPRCGPRARGH